MSDIIIKVENLSKQYIISHQQSGGYTTLRDKLTEGAQSLGRKLLAPTGKKHFDLSKEEFWALKDVSFEVKQGDRVGIIGRNGAGKSTLLKILSRITEPTVGQVTIQGRVASLLEVGTGFHPELTGRENIYLNGAILGMSKAEIQRKFDEIVDFAEIEKFLDTPVKRYSSGMYVRLAFAVAAHLESDILIVDEVLAVGDLEFQKKCLGKMQSISQGQDRTVLFISHNIDAIQRLCCKCLFLKGGKLEAFDETHKVLLDYTADFASKALPNKWIDLASANRSGSRQAYFTAIKYSSLNEAVQFQLYSDCSFECFLEIFSDSLRMVNSLAVTIYNQSGYKLVNADTLSQDCTLMLQAGYNTVKLTIDELHLQPGTYTLGLWLARSTGSTDKHEVYDYSDAVFEFDVISWKRKLVEQDGVVSVNFRVSEVKSSSTPKLPYASVET